MEIAMNAVQMQIETAVIPTGSVQLWWLGGAGFAFKTATGTRLLLDPYLSDSVERLHGFKRMNASPLRPEDVRCDAVICTHDHTDHLDPDTVPVIAGNNPGCVFAGPASCMAGFRALGIAPERLVELPRRGTATVSGITVHTAPSDHGDGSADALTMLLDCGGVRVLHSGDTSLCPVRFRPLYDLQPDLLLPCINGNFGNMNAIDAAQMAQQAKPHTAIPHHFWLFVEHGGDPAAFLHACRYYCPDVKALILRPGEGFLCRGRGPTDDVLGRDGAVGVGGIR
jgi:L-ascorbate 6-phosphate lactonase